MAMAGQMTGQMTEQMAEQMTEQMTEQMNKQMTEQMAKQMMQMREQMMQMMQGMDMSTMQMGLFSRTRDFNVLFRTARIGSTGGFVGALFAVFFFAVLATIIIEIVKTVELNARYKRKFPLLAGASVAHAISLLFHYTAMLLVMTMSIWVILAVVVGHGFGWAVFAFLENKVPWLKKSKTRHEIVLDDEGNKISHASKTGVEGGACPC